MNDHDEIELRSDEVKEILGRTPRWIVRSGTGLFLTIIVVMLIGSWFFKYPDVINSRLIVTTENPPVELIARATGKIAQLKIENNQQVAQQQLLAVIDNAANLQDVFLLKDKLQAVCIHQISNSEQLNNLTERSYQLGELQTDYNEFLKSFSDYNRFIDLRYYQRKKSALLKQLKQYQIHYNRQYQQKEVLNKEMLISKKEYERDSLLWKRGVIAESLFHATKKQYLKMVYNYYGARSSLSSTQITISGVEQQVVDLELDEEREQKQYIDGLTQAFDNLKAEIAIWEQKYLLRSPISGKVSFNKFWNTNQNIKTGDQVFTVVPNDSTQLMARMQLGILGAGKVKVGQRVNIKLDNYPYMEYGMLEGKIRTISRVPENQQYSLEVDFPNGLTTNYDIQLKFSQKIEGSAEIITDDYRLLQRIFNPIRALLKKRL